MKGTVTVLDIPSDAELPELTQQVEANNFRVDRANSDRFAWRSGNPIPLYGGEKPSPIKHIVFISKENRTYDEVFGQIASGEGDPSLARYGRHATFTNKAGNEEVADAVVMPNHLELARTFAIADNFYVDSDVSADGHRWLVNTYPNEWVETTTAASYGGNRSYDPESIAPGSLAMNGTAGAIYPEDYNEAGSMWDHLDRHGVDFFNFGFGIMFEPGVYHESFKYTGIRHFVNYPVPAPIFDRTSRTFPTYNMAIPDQFRVDQFIREFRDKWEDGGLPSMLTVILPNDHGAADRPEAGYPFRESYMADNDLALGRIVEFLSRTRYWGEMAIVITEDDAQNGVDHIDAHRSLLMVVSPWAKRGHVGKVHYSFGSIFKTFWNVLGLPYLNQYDAGATDLADLFTDRPDPTPYQALPVDPRIFDPQRALDPLDEEYDWVALGESPVIDNPSDMLMYSKEREEDRRQQREN
jgi:phospholipase C